MDLNVVSGSSGLAANLCTHAVPAVRSNSLPSRSQVLPTRTTTYPCSACNIVSFIADLCPSISTVKISRASLIFKTLPGFSSSFLVRTFELPWKLIYFELEIDLYTPWKLNYISEIKDYHIRSENLTETNSNVKIFDKVNYYNIVHSHTQMRRHFPSNMHMLFKCWSVLTPRIKHSVAHLITAVARKATIIFTNTYKTQTHAMFHYIIPHVSTSQHDSRMLVLQIKLLSRRNSMQRHDFTLVFRNTIQLVSSQVYIPTVVFGYSFSQQRSATPNVMSSLIISKYKELKLLSYSSWPTRMIPFFVYYYLPLDFIDALVSGLGEISTSTPKIYRNDFRGGGCRGVAQTFDYFQLQPYLTSTCAIKSPASVLYRLRSIENETEAQNSNPLLLYVKIPYKHLYPLLTFQQLKDLAAFHSIKAPGNIRKQKLTESFDTHICESGCTDPVIKGRRQREISSLVRSGKGLVPR
jgi:hypothetical protein